MTRKARLWGAGLLIGASLGMAGPATAQVPYCVGTTSTIWVCSDPTGGTVISDCVYTGDPTCTPVTVPGPTLTCGSPLAPLRCRGF